MVLQLNRISDEVVADIISQVARNRHQTEAIQRAETAREEAEAALARQRDLLAAAEARAEAAERHLALDRARGMCRILDPLASFTNSLYRASLPSIR